MTNTTLSDALKSVLADSYALYLKTQNYHWNVTGPHFKSLHDLFEAQYTEISTAIDEIAERIRSLGDKAPASFSYFAQRTQIKDGDENATAADMVQDLHSAQNVILATLSTALEIAQEQNDEVTIGLIIDRMTAHEQNRWMLKSSL